jgi:hypothetical protein
MSLADAAVLLYMPALAIVACWLYGLPKTDEAANPWTELDGFDNDHTQKRGTA